MAIKYLGTFRKQPAEVLPYDYIPSDDMEDGDTIASVAVDVTDLNTNTLNPGSPGLNVASTAVVNTVGGDKKAVINLREGVDGRKYKVTVRATAAGGPPYVYEDDFLVEVRAK